MLCVLLLRNNALWLACAKSFASELAADLPGVVVQTEAATKLNPHDDVAIYQELLAEHRLQHLDKTTTLVNKLEIAKEHNQQGATKYVLQEATGTSAKLAVTSHAL